MNRAKARQYIVSAQGNAFVAAWICILDEYKIHTSFEVPPDEWYRAFEELYLNDAVDPDVFNDCDVKRIFYSGSSVRHKDVEDAFWNLKYLRGLHPGEAADCEDSLMNKRYPDAPAPDEDEMFDQPPTQPGALVRALNEERQIERVLGEPIGMPAVIARPELPALAGPLIEEEMALTPLSEPRQLSDGPDIRSLPCQDPQPPKFGRPYTEIANFNLTCCGEEVDLEESGNSDFWESEGDADHDGMDLALEGSCARCGTQFCFSAAMPIPKGALTSEF